MTEFASRARGFGSVLAPRSSIEPAAKPRTPAEEASDRTHAFVREVSALDAAIVAVQRASDANDQQRWQDAKQSLDRQLAAARKSHERTRELARREPDAEQEMAAATVMLANHERIAATLSEAPRGWREVSREAEILAVATSPIEGNARDGWTRKASALKSAFGSLSAAESRTLAGRLRKQRHNDPIAMALSPGVRVTRERFGELLAFLDGAPRREALRSSREPIGPQVAPQSNSEPVSDVNDGPQKIPDNVRGELEQATGRTLDHVRVHAGERGAAVAAQYGARAVAIGHDIHMGEGQLDTVSADGRELIAHEVGHVVQADALSGPVGIAAKRDDETHEDAAERDADRFAARFRADGAAAKWTPSVSVTGASPMRAPARGKTRSSEPEGKESAPTPIVRVDQIATTKSYGKELVTAGGYLSMWATELLDVMVKNAGPVPPDPHVRLRWTTPAIVVDQLQMWMTMERPRFGADDRALLVRLFHPMDLYAMVDAYRDIRPQAPGHEAEGPLGTSAWQTAIGDTVAAEARPRLRAAILHAGQRYVAAADSLHASGVRAEQAIKKELATNNAVLPSTPLEHIALLAMRDAQMVTYTPPTAKSPREPAPEKLRPLLIKCMGEKDPTLWNVLLVETPDATAEQLAAVLFNRGDDGVAHTYNADLITVAAPYFVIPPAWAARLHKIGAQLGPAAYEPKVAKRRREDNRYNPEAAQRATEQAAPDPRTLLAESALADEIALAQSDLETRRGSSEAHGKGDDEKSEVLDSMLSVDAVALITRGRSQLDYLHGVMAPWSLFELLAPSSDFLSRAQEKTTRSDVLNASWSSLLARQGRLLSQISEQVGTFVREVGAPALNGGDPTGPVGRVLATYARAAGASHQIGSGSALLAEATRLRQGVMLATIELAVQSSGGAVSEERTREHSARDVDGESLHLDDTQRSIRMRAAEMRNALIQGKGVDAGAAEELILEAEENRLIASISSLKLQFREFKSAADQGTLGFLPGIVQSTELLNMRADAPFMEAELAQIHEFLKDGHKIIYGPRDPKDASAPWLPDIATRKRDNLRQHVQSAHAKLATLKQEQRIEQFLQRADKVLADQRWRMMIAEAAAMIGVGLVTGGVASFVGGAVRGMMMLDLSAETAGIVSTMRTARAFGAAAEIVTDATLSGAAQHALTGGDAAIAESIVSNALTRFALTPLGRLSSGLGEVDKKSLDMWQRVGHGAKFVLAHGAQLSAEMLTGTAISYAVHRVAAWKRGEHPSDEMVDSWLLQGASFAIGRFLNGRLRHRMQQLDKLGQRIGSLPRRMEKLAHRAAELERTGSPDEALDILIEHRSVIDDEIALIAKLEREGVIHANEADVLRADAHADGDVIKSQAFVAVEARAAGLEPVVESAGRWAGDSKEIANAIFKARALGLDVRIVEIGNQQKRWRVKFGDDMLEIDELPPKAIVGQRNGRQDAGANVRDDVRDLLRAKAAVELAQIRITMAPTEHASRGYLVTPAEGRRMVELFTDLGAEMTEYKNGVLVRMPPAPGVDAGGLREWYFEFRDDAHTGHSRAKAPDEHATTSTTKLGAGERAASTGLPDTNVATIEIYGYSGVRSINGRKLSDMSEAEREAIKAEANAEDPLLMAGHVAISWDGGKTVYGFTPDTSTPGVAGLSVETVVQKLRNGEVIPGNVKLDNDHYEKAAAKLAKKGWDTEVTRVVMTFDPNERSAIKNRTLGELEANERGEHSHGYWFPKKDTMPKDTVATNGQEFAGNLIANCAAWLRLAGVPIPEPTGRMSEYMPALKEWGAADAPVAGRGKGNAK